MGIFDKFKKHNTENNSNNKMLNVERTNVLDAVAYDEENSKLIMLLSDGMDWYDEARHLLLLQEKLNHYIAYIETEQYLKSYPKPKQIEIQIKFLFKETELCEKFLEQVKQIVKESLNNTTITVEHRTENAF